jgi:hypothetical protein
MHHAAKWTPELDARLREGLARYPIKTGQRGWDKIAAHVGAGMGENGCRARATRIGTDTGPAAAPRSAPSPQTTDSLTPWLEQLRPIHYAAPALPTRRVAPTNTVVVAGDFHFPTNDERCEDILLQVVADLKPRAVVLNGDLPDLLAVSRFPKDLRHQWSLFEERRALHATLRRLHEATAATGAEIVETDSNHSGNGVEGRWMRYLSDRLGELACLPDVVEALSYARVWHPPEEWSRVRLVEDYEILPYLVALHGDVVRKQAGYSANGMLLKYRGIVSLIHNHTHRLGATGNRIPRLGRQAEGMIRGYENGCMCHLAPHYAKAADWQQGFSIVHHDDEGHFNVEQVSITDGVAVVGSLGGSYRAAA